MKHYRNSLGFLALAGLFILASPQSRADDWNKKTNVTVDQPIQLPTVVLQPGTYVFKLMDSQADRHIVQVFDKDDQHLITTVLAIPNYRLKPTGKTVFTFWETASGQPAPVRAWFYPGDNFGQEFAYPKNKSMQIAARSKTAVITTAAESKEEMNTTSVTTTSETGETKELEKTYSEPVVTAEPTPTPVAAEPPPQPAVETKPAEPPPAAAAPAPVAEPAPAPLPAELPKTGSQVPLLGILGLMALVSFILTRSSSRVR